MNNIKEAPEKEPVNYDKSFGFTREKVKESDFGGKSII